MSVAAHSLIYFESGKAAQYDKRNRKENG